MQRIMSFLSPSVARKRNRIEEKIMNKKRPRLQISVRRSSSHTPKVENHVHYPPSKGEFTFTRIEYGIPRCADYNPLLTTLTKGELEKYLNFLKSHYVQTFYGPLLQLLMQHKDNHGIFNVPVNPDTQNLPSYYKVVENPMDLGTIRDNLAIGKYMTPREFLADVRLVFTNAKRFNPEKHFINVCATNLLKLVDVEVEKIRARYEQTKNSQHNHQCLSCQGCPCHLCGEKCLKYSPPVFVCDGDCHERILRNAIYYIMRGKKGRFCQKCYAKKVVGMDKAERKNLFIRKKNDSVYNEEWIQCTRCGEWMHCICGLVHPRQKTSNYICPQCLIEDPFRVPKPCFGSKAIPICSLSEFITNMLFKTVDTEVLRLPSRLRPSDEQLKDLKDSLVVRVISNISTSVSVKAPLVPLYTHTDSKELTISYQSKCIAFFQHRDGVDILLFVLYVHEFDEHVVTPNRRSLYISYLDSVHFLHPRYLRTPLYHTILTAYLDYAKQRGFTRAHIWACPPSRGDDYIFSHHPRDQRTPNADHLIAWYRTLLAKGVDAGIVSHVTCQVDELLHINAVRSNNPDQNQRQIRCFSVRGVTEGELPESVLERVQSTSINSDSPLSSDYESDSSNSNENEEELSSELSSLSTTTSATATISSSEDSKQIASPLPPNGFSDTEKVLLSTLPYFEGDYLPYVGEDLLKEIYQDMQKQKVSKPTLSRVSSISSSTKNKAELRERLLQDNILQLPNEFLRKYAKSMLENPARFIIAYLRPYCSCCGEIIEGEGRRCDECNQHNVPFFLCATCFKRHVFHPHELVCINEPPLVPTRQDDPVISFPFLDKRHEFLRLCQGNFLQFDTLRHSILSTSVVLEFIFHKVPDPFLDMCDSCEKILRDEYYNCRHNDDYRLCKDCLNKDGGIHARTHLQASENSL